MAIENDNSIVLIYCKLISLDGRYLWDIRVATQETYNSRDIYFNFAGINPQQNLKFKFHIILQTYTLYNIYYYENIKKESLTINHQKHTSNFFIHSSSKTKPPNFKKRSMDNTSSMIP